MMLLLPVLLVVVVDVVVLAGVLPLHDAGVAGDALVQSCPCLVWPPLSLLASISCRICSP